MTADQAGGAPPPVRSVEELADELRIDLRYVPVDAIDFTPGNPNELSDEQRTALSAEIDRGFLQPIVVRDKGGGRWQCVDGEHRVEIVAEKGFRAIPAVVMAGDEDEAKVRLLTMNGLRGQFVPIRMAYMLADLAQRIPEDELRARLAMDVPEFRDTLALATFTDPVEERMREAREREEREAPIVLSFPVRRQDAAAIERVVAPLISDKMDRGRALAQVCRDYERTAKERRKA